MVSRRDFLNFSAATIALTALPSQIQSKQLIRNYKLTAGITPHLFDKKGVSDNLWLYNKQTPGPIIEAKENDVVRVEFVNNLHEATTIHWHGIKNINKMDGVPYLTQDPIQPGESFLYEFPVKNAGTFWYHAHVQTWKQISKGLYGPLVVKNHLDEQFDNDLIILADDWRLNKNYQIDKKSFGSLHDWSHAGRIGNWLTINGKKIPKYSINKNGHTRLRFINASNARILSFGSSLDGMKIISIDGMSVEPFIEDKFNLGPGQRIDLLIKTDDLSTIDFFEVSGKKPISAFILNINQNGKKNIRKKDINLQSFKKIPHYKNPRILKIHMQGGAMGNLAKAYFEGVEKNFRSLAMEDKKFWAFNKEVGKYEKSLASVKKGQTIILEVWNDSRWPHSMHLHGNHFYVESKEFSDTDKLVLRDTYLMQPGEKSKFTYIADNPGKWLFHCHMLEHAASGMIGYIEVL